MPPFLPRKRSSSPRSAREPPSKKPKLADTLDGGATNDLPNKKRAVFSVDSDSDSESDSTLSDVDSDQFEDVVTEPRKELDDEDEDIEWEDAAPADAAEQPKRVALANGPIQLEFRKEDETIDYTAMSSAAKKGPSRREKQARIDTHKMHVQFLIWHNSIRNAWVSDKQVQRTLLSQLPPQIVQEVEKWKRASGLSQEKPKQSPQKTKGGGRKSKKGKHVRNQRDWGNPSQRLEAGKPDMSHGDPLISLMKVLAAYWKKRFAIITPGLRKRGYGTKQQLKRDIHSYRNEEHDPVKHGEKILDLKAFRKVAATCQGSRDTGAQLFTALVRALGIEARLVASLQPSGYGWTKAEQMLPRKVVADHETTSDRVRKVSDSTIGDRKKGQKRRSGTKTSAIILDTDAEDDGSLSPAEDDDSVVDVTVSMPVQRRARYDRDLAFPIYWTEAISPITCKVLPVSPLVLDIAVASTPEALSTFEPRGSKAEKTHQVMAYVIAHSTDGTAKDVTVRYLRKRLWPGKTKGFRYPIEKVPIYDQTGRIKKYENYDWFKHIISLYTRSTHMRTATDDVEDATDLVPAQPDKKENSGVDTLQSLKASTEFVLERFLRREEALKPTAKVDRMFASGKGDNIKEEPVYLRADVERCLTAESWHKEGRRPQLGETPMKLVPVRAVTLTRKREAEEHERVTGEKQMQGLYSWDQTEWIIPEPIRDGVIPKNSYGNMDCFVPSMVPKGAVHIPLKGTVRICKKLDIDFAEAVTGFEFGNKRAVPVCTGVVVASENEMQVRKAWKVYQEEQKRKEESKMEKLVLDTWKKFVIGLRIRERVAAQYGGQLSLDDNPTGLHEDDPIDIDSDSEENKHRAPDTNDQRGGFLVEDEADEAGGGGFLLPHEDDESEAGELVLDDGEEPKSFERNTASSSLAQYPTPNSMVTRHGDNGHEILSSLVDEKRRANSSDEGQKALTPVVPTRDASSRRSRATMRGVKSKISEQQPNDDDDDDTSQSGSNRESSASSPDTSKRTTAEVTSSDSSDDDDNDDKYIPRSTKRPRQASVKDSTPQSASASTSKVRKSRTTASSAVSTPKSNTRSTGKKRSTGVKSRLVTTPVSKRSRRKTTTLTSPYFDGSE